MTPDCFLATSLMRNMLTVSHRLSHQRCRLFSIILSTKLMPIVLWRQNVFPLVRVTSKQIRANCFLDHPSTEPAHCHSNAQACYNAQNHQNWYSLHKCLIVGAYNIVYRSRVIKKYSRQGPPTGAHHPFDLPTPPDAPRASTTRRTAVAVASGVAIAFQELPGSPLIADAALQ